MSVATIREEVISQFVRKVSSIEDEAALKVILDFLSGIKEENETALNLSRHFTKIQDKYGDVLKRLAE